MEVVTASSSALFLLRSLTGTLEVMSRVFLFPLKGILVEVVVVVVHLRLIFFLPLEEESAQRESPDQLQFLISPVCNPYHFYQLLSLLQVEEFLFSEEDLRLIFV
jgi:hypothetical protein